MKEKVIAGLTIFAGVVVIVLGIVILIYGNRLKKIVKNSTYIGETISEENNEKYVIATGKLTLATPAHDEKLNINLNTPIAYRKSQVLKKELKTTNSTEYDSTWNVREENEKINGELKVGAITLSQEFIDKLSTTGYYSEYNEEELKTSKLQLYKEDVNEVSQYYLVDSSHDISAEDIDFINGEIRYYFTYYNLNDHPEVTIVGKQVDGKIYPIDELGNKIIFDGILDHKETIKKFNNKVWIFAVVTFIIAGLIIAWGVFRLREELMLTKKQ